ncbi:AcrR family transcriptional regulator [Halorubrum alkaliphilum]|uniref:AcrR family transcriptional regulator n=1 Tax=Halorubrum alkaliphilum TaxID=261290 RepID=A0A8T4GBH7_9EURY|nr:TetR/AcrR family transcriptional regulator [Halorubrum alkaliphilum]MBP1921453.1 AcrR family transcriptional regulator [Halorubrum alkaliphilum]
MSDQPSAADEIMDGVYHALRAHGYADLTMQDIADECSKSKSLLHYHYDTKEDLLVAFLEHIITDSAERIEAHADDPATDRLVAFIGWFVFDADAVDREAFHIALLELRTQGPFNDRIREQLDRSDRVLRGTVAGILESGIEEGVFREVDVEETAALLVATLDGARTRQITLSGTADDGVDPTYTRRVAEASLTRVIDPILAEGVELPPLADGIGELTRETGEE